VKAILCSFIKFNQNRSRRLDSGEPAVAGE